MNEREKTLIPYNTLIKKYEKEICENCISEKCEKGIMIITCPNEGVCIKCIDYKYKYSKKNKKESENECQKQNEEKKEKYIIGNMK